MNIGDVSRLSGLPTKTIRYYEDMGLISPRRGENGYRVFAPRDMHKLAFLGRARRLGFSLEDCRNLLALYEDRDRSSAEVKAIARTHLGHIETRLNELREMRRTLTDLVDKCAGDHRPDCPILADLAAETGQPKPE
ncbi:Cu(I)-responsive transcriptional regulator [Pukyongiella litopenaei]|uniref:Cu(I)-responsive transcriptional regulator n=1 Tax=Pukyongiella litopenaei TaxID=2605946 RepID=A0A2S0MLC7_9RHOB|nr:Cu(I)-responsive transcriptional regulator [Pukyongiella litopenaei]AVO36672.1 Cu(I)-responsive transcriptional regulator [Pukyongiella litopenaei]